MSDEFPQTVKVELAMRAGLTCSNPDCRVYTGGPDDNIGVASHITAKSSGGPRFERSLSSEERRSSNNGIWLCQSCGKLVDSKVHETRYPVGLLRLWKSIAERQASLYVGRTSPFLADLAPVSSEHGRLIELSTVTNNYGLFEILRHQPYIYPVTSDAREAIVAHDAPSSVLDWAAKILVDCWSERDDELLGICATLLSSSFQLWNPATHVLDALEELCLAELKDRDHALIGLVEPLAFALATKGRDQPHHFFLSAIVSEEHWRSAEDARSGRYYGSESRKVVAVARHMRDPLRAGLLRANDVGRLMGLLARPTPDLSRARTRNLLRGLLRESLRDLDRYGEAGLVREATTYLGSIGIDLETDSSDE